MVRRLAVLVGVLVGVLVAPSAAVAAGPQQSTALFTFTGFEQFWDVPVGVTTVDVVAVGARGGQGGAFFATPSLSGGVGAVRSGSIVVVPGQRLYVNVGGVGGKGTDSGPPSAPGGPGGFNGGANGATATSSGGGGGGGASDVRSVSRFYDGSLASRLIVAGGGGGGGGTSPFPGGGVGGAADQPGAAGGTAGVNVGGGAGSQTAGGLPNGALGVGGPGLAASLEGGGGGGGGLYGGGGGSGSSFGAGGGGGGSSFYAPQVSNSGTSGATPGDQPRVLLTYNVPAAEVPQGPKGDTGAQGLPGPAGKDGQFVLVAYQATASASKVTVRYALTGPAAITLKVKPRKGAEATVAKANGKAGINQISWNRKLKSKKASKGTYKLTITATAAGRTVSSTVSVKLK